MQTSIIFVLFSALSLAMANPMPNPAPNPVPNPAPNPEPAPQWTWGRKSVRCYDSSDCDGGSCRRAWYSPGAGTCA
ncbi:hypothetical protein BDV3_001803 [Batrachochytrium dendrobatidis]